MSTAIITPIRTTPTVAATSVGGARQPRLRLTRRGRAVFTTLAAVPVLLGVGIAMLNGGQASAGNDTGAGATRFETVTIEPGESLWQVAEEQAPNSDPRQVVQDIVTLNNLQGSAVQAGQQVSIPTAYTSAK